MLNLEIKSEVQIPGFSSISLKILPSGILKKISSSFSKTDLGTFPSSI